MTFFDSFRKETKPVKGTVERFGPSFGAGQINGYIALLVGDRTPYVILRDDQETDTTVGLTAPGDSVEFLASNSRSVDLSSFVNLTLASRMSGRS